MTSENNKSAINTESSLEDLLNFMEVASPEQLAKLADYAASLLKASGNLESGIDLTLRKWLRKEIEETELLRALVSFDKWDVPVEDDELLAALKENRPSRWAVREEDGVKRLLVFTGPAAGRAYSGEKGGSFTQVSGTHLFSLMDERFDSLSINPYSETAISYGKEQFSILREVAQAVKIERTLLALRAADKEFEKSVWVEIKNYPNYILPVKVEASGNWSGIAMAPDTKNRNLLPIFTAEDHFFSFQKDYSGQGDEQSVVAPHKLSGAELFRQIPKMNDIDGVVFNCESDNPVAFAPEIAQMILDGAKENYIRINYKEAIMFASGSVSEADYDSTLFCRFPADYIEGETVKPENLEAAYQLLYGENWRAGNDDGSKYLVLRPETHILTIAEEQAEPWRSLNLQDKNHHYWFFKVSGTGEIIKSEQAEF